MSSAAANDFWDRASNSLMKTGVPFSPAIIVGAQGARLYDHEDRQILDFTSGQMSSLLGHSYPEIVQVIRKYAAEFDHLLSNIISPPVIDLAERLQQLLPRPLEKSFFLNTGGESVEAAIKLAKCYTGKFEIIRNHCLTQGVVSATYSAGRKYGGPIIPGQFAFPAPYAYRSPFRRADGSYDWEAEIDYGWFLIDRQTVGSLAAFVMEPILSTGGVLELSLRAIYTECVPSARNGGS